jgi:hypothetical protein
MTDEQRQSDRTCHGFDAPVVRCFEAGQHLEELVALDRLSLGAALAMLLVSVVAATIGVMRSRRRDPRDT